jgi:hypothetical protein
MSNNSSSLSPREKLMASATSPEWKQESFISSSKKVLYTTRDLLGIRSSEGGIRRSSKWGNWNSLESGKEELTAHAVTRAVYSDNSRRRSDRPWSAPHTHASEHWAQCWGDHHQSDSSYHKKDTHRKINERGVEIYENNSRGRCPTTSSP